VEEESSKTASIRENEVNNTSQGGTSVSTLASSIQSRIKGVRVSMVNQDSTQRLPAFHGMGRDNAKQKWFTCESIWSMKRVTYEAYKVP
jgi:hypothetical protein